MQPKAAWRHAAPQLLHRVAIECYIFIFFLAVYRFRIKRHEFAPGGARATPSYRGSLYRVV